MSEKPRLDTTRLQKIAQAYWESAALMAAVELEIFTAIAHGHDTVPAAAKAVGRAIAERTKAAGVSKVAFDRAGFQFHGRVKALADAAREAGLEF